MIHKFSLLGSNIVLDVNSGSVHVMDNASFDTLDYYETGNKTEIVQKLRYKYKEETIYESLSEIEQLIEDGLLFSEDPYLSLQAKDNQAVVKALCLHVAHDCNLRCRYCFAEEGRYFGPGELMSIETGKAAVDFVIKNSGNRKNIEIDFFGGEPLLNFKAVKEITRYAISAGEKNGKSFRFTLTTNGVLLNDETEKFLNENMSNVVLSLDGRKEINDSMRFFPGGRGSYDMIMPKFQKLAESRKQKNYYVRGTYTRHNTDFYEDVIHLADLGFRQISLEPAIGGPDSDYSITEDDLNTVYGQYEKLAGEILKREKEGKGFNFFHFSIDFSGGPCVYKRLKGCGSGTEYLSVTPNGDLYPCHQFAGIPEFKMGDIFKGDISKEIQNKFLETNVNSKEDCLKCWAKFYCSGGCPANGFQLGGGLDKTYTAGCAVQRKRIECAIALKASALINPPQAV